MKDCEVIKTGKNHILLVDEKATSPFSILYIYLSLRFYTSFKKTETQLLSVCLKNKNLRECS